MNEKKAVETGMREQVARDLEYLDKEMPIMGLLGTICGMAVWGGIPLIASLPNDYDAWLKRVLQEGGAALLLGLILMLSASLLFYSQRSRLAWSHGQLPLTLQEHNITGKSTWKWLRITSSWISWIYYRYAFSCLCTGFVELGLVATDHPPASPAWVRGSRETQPLTAAVFTLFLCLFACFRGIQVVSG